eukprot:TRINITY_DN8574_c0_g1_i1.p1 TRINITY_DN8574_c0_g1~~TRINITY_DN8574_c0_g1_i1.p1  ORF type:complete len:199 (+),score=54.02 TRINITY_DN8574_c0_g1_i1:34-630(+)
MFKNKVNEKNIVSLFNNLKENELNEDEKEYISDEKLFSQLSIEMSDTVSFVVIFHLKAAHFGEVTKEEFIEGMTELGVDSLEGLKKLVPSFREELKNKTKFKAIWKFLYFWSLERGAKNLDIEAATALLDSVIKNRPHIPNFIQFLKQCGKTHIHKDFWIQLVDWSDTINTDFSNYDNQDYWVLLFDEFVEWSKKNKN